MHANQLRVMQAYNVQYPRQIALHASLAGFYLPIFQHHHPIHSSQRRALLGAIEAVRYEMRCTKSIGKIVRVDGLRLLVACGPCAKSAKRVDGELVVTRCRFRRSAEFAKVMVLKCGKCVL